MRSPASLSGRSFLNFLSLLVCSSALWSAGIPTMDLLERGEVGKDAKGVSDTFFGTSKEGKYLIKADRPVSIRGSDGTRVLGTYGNLEGELLSSKILKKLGVLTPGTEAVHIKGKKGVFLRSEFMDQKLLGSGKVYRGVSALPSSARLDLRKLRALQVADLLIGNTDRHYNNAWFVKNTRTKLFEPVAFDHNFALGDKVLSPKWEGGATFQNSMSVAKTPRGAIPSEATKIALSRNRLYERALQNPHQTEDYFKEAARLQKALPDKVLKQMVADIPNEAFGPRNPALRRQQLLERLIQRRDRLPQVLEGSLRGSMQAYGGMVALDGLPPRLNRFLPQTRAARTKLEMELAGAKGTSGGRFHPQRVYGKLLETGMPREAAREMTAILGRQAGHTVQAANLLKKPGANSGFLKWSRTTSGTSVEKLLNSKNYPSNENLAKKMLSEESGKIRGVGGNPPPPPGSAPRRILEVARKDFKPGPGQRLRVLEIPGRPGDYQALLQGADGKILKEGFWTAEGIEGLKTSPVPRNLSQKALQAPNDFDLVQSRDGETGKFRSRKMNSAMPADQVAELKKELTGLRKKLKIGPNQALRIKFVENVNGGEPHRILQVRGSDGRWTSQALVTQEAVDFKVRPLAGGKGLDVLKRREGTSWEGFIKKTPEKISPRLKKPPKAKKVGPSKLQPDSPPKRNVPIKKRQAAPVKRRLAPPRGGSESQQPGRKFRPKFRPRVRVKGIKL
jgi:hypothetical protein